MVVKQMKLVTEQRRKRTRCERHVSIMLEQRITLDDAYLRDEKNIVMQLLRATTLRKEPKTGSLEKEASKE